MAQYSAPTPSIAPPLVGREREQAVLRDALEAALAGRGSLVLIGGEAGIGKTTLAETLLSEAADRGALVLVGRCYDLADTPPYGPWAEILARVPHGDGLPEPLDFTGGGVASQAALFAAARNYLAALAAHQPLVLLLDDVHWADSATLDLLRTLARALADLPLLLLVTYRADELTRRHALYQLLPTLERETRAVRLDLRPLGRDALRALVWRYALTEGDTARLVTWLQSRAEGNAFFTSQLLRALEDEGTLAAGEKGWALGDLRLVGLPAPLRQVLDARLDRLGEETRHQLALAAVVGQEVPLWLWAAVAGTDEDGLLDGVERAVGARLLEALPAGDAVRFAHALIREALYAGLLPVRRRRVHQRAAELLLAQAAPDPDTVAHHLLRAGDPRAYAWLVSAGERAQRVYAWVTAAERFEAALALLDAAGGDTGERGWLCIRLARLRRHDDQRRALAHAERAAALAAEAGDAALAAYAPFHRGLLRLRAGDQRAGLDDMVAAVAAQESLAPDDHARLAAMRAALGEPLDDHHDRAQLALMLNIPGRFAEVAAIAEPIVAATPTHGGPAGTLSRFALALARAHLGQPEEARRRFAEARAGAVAHGNYWLVGQTAFLELLALRLPYDADRPAECERVAREGEAGWRRASGILGADATPELAWLPLLVLAGRWGEARALAAATRAAGGTNAPVAVTLLAILAVARGEVGLAAELVREGLPGGPATEPGEAPFEAALPLQRAAAALALRTGDLPTARHWLACHDRWLEQTGAIPGPAEGALGWADYHRAAGDPARARGQADEAQRLASAPRQPLALLAAHRLLGELDTTAGRLVEARAHLDAALALADACAAPYERALTLLALAELRAAEGRPGEADAPLADARASFSDLGAAPALARADTLADRLATPPPSAATEHALPFGLSAREAEVLRLVVAGLTNAQAAERLFVTPRTVNAHLTSIYTKLGVEGRAAAIRVALDHGLR